MHLRRTLTTAALALATGLSASGASAAILSITYTGQIYQGSDETGVFGLAGQSLVGQAFTAKFIVDTAKAGALHDTDVFYDVLYGYGAAGPVSGSITINGFTEAFGNDYNADSRHDYSLQPGCDPSACGDGMFMQKAQNLEQHLEGSILYSASGLLSGGGTSSDGTISGFAHTAVNYTGLPVTLGGYAEIYDYALDLSANKTTTIRKATAALLVASVTTQTFGAGIDEPTSAAPEPASWALMIAGFGMAGATLRRRRVLAGG